MSSTESLSAVISFCFIKSSMGFLIRMLCFRMTSVFAFYNKILWIYILSTVHEYSMIVISVYSPRFPPWPRCSWLLFCNMTVLHYIFTRVNNIASVGAPEMILSHGIAALHSTSATHRDIVLTYVLLCLCMHTWYTWYNIFVFISIYCVSQSRYI